MRAAAGPARRRKAGYERHGVEIVVRGFALVAASWLMREIGHGTPHPAA